MQGSLSTLAWISCVIYSTIPAFWLLIHPRADFWRSRPTSPYKILIPLWAALWTIVAAATYRWRTATFYQNKWMWIPAAVIFCTGLILYKLSHAHFTLAQLGGLPELLPGRDQQLVTTGIRARIRHPIYLAHLCEMLAWSLGSGLAVCWSLTIFAIATGAIMIRMEEKELGKRFGETYRHYQKTVPALLPTLNRPKE